MLRYSWLNNLDVATPSSDTSCIGILCIAFLLVSSKVLSIILMRPYTHLCTISDVSYSKVSGVRLAVKDAVWNMSAIKKEVKNGPCVLHTSVIICFVQS